MPYLHLMRLHKPIGILLLLWPTLWALWLASDGHPAPRLVMVFITGVILMRSAGCVINDFADRHLDPQVSRTRERPLAAGLIQPDKALLLFSALLMTAAGLLFFLNPLTRALAVLSVLLTILYPLLKRVTHLPQVGLGIAFAFGIPMAFTACRNKLPLTALYPFAATFFWIIMYDTLYAMADREDDLTAGIRSTAILFGRYDRMAIALLQGLTLTCLFMTGIAFHLTNFFNMSLGIVSLLFAYQSWLIRTSDPANCLNAFTHNHWVGLIVFIGILC